ncbi:MAG: sigma-70 family RNA polymerase sigma factor [Clostridia bacterium]|nr:sigma-70 family RNA polymerase sigma factor [Clostridia bacterium]
MQDDILLIKQYREGNEKAMEELLEKYKRLVNSIARSFFLKGVDTDDIVQEGMIGLLKAINTFNLDGKVSFITYAHECIKNRLLDYIRNGTRLKNKALSDSVPISAVEEADSCSLTPEEIAINAEEVETLKLIIVTSLTNDERKILNMYYDGKSYSEIAQEIGKNTKYVDNVLQKIRRKIKTQFNKR